jgi:hypothetical protein
VEVVPPPELLAVELAVPVPGRLERVGRVRQRGLCVGVQRLEPGAARVGRGATRP